MTAELWRMPSGDAVRLRSLLGGQGIVIDRISPVVNGGASFAQAYRGEAVKVSCSVFSEGEGPFAVLARWRHVDNCDWDTMHLCRDGDSVWSGCFCVDQSGLHVFCIDAWVDQYAGLCIELHRKYRAGDPVSDVVEHAINQVLFAAERWEGTEWQQLLLALHHRLIGLSEDQQIAVLLHENSAVLMRDAQERTCLALSPEFSLFVTD